MIDRFTSMLQRPLTVDWSRDLGPLDLRNHAMGIGGVHSSPAPQAVVEAAAALRPRMIRIFLQEFFYIYPDHGVYDWSRLDAYMAAVHAMGGAIMASICIKPKVLYPAIDEYVWRPNNVTEWQDVIRAMALRYSVEKPYVTHWAIANEMNIGEWGGCPYRMENPDDFFEYYRMTAEPIRAAVPGVKVGGPSYAGSGDGAAKYLGRFVELCRQHGVAVDFTGYNAYTDSPEDHVTGCRAIREAIDQHAPGLPLYMTEFNNGLLGSDEPSLEEKASDPRHAACLAASVLALHDDGGLDGSFQYHIYDQWCDPREFAPWFARPRYMAEHWNDTPHRLRLLDLDGNPGPQYFLYQMLYALAGHRTSLAGTDNILRGLASRGDDGTLSIFLTNHAATDTPDAVSRLRFANAPGGVYRLTVQRIVTTLENTGLSTASPTVENRTVYVHPDFHFDVFTPADTVTLIQLKKLEITDGAR